MSSSPPVIDLPTAIEMALALPEVEEQEHWGRPSFRVRKRIFATVWPEERRMVLKLSFADQAALCAMRPGAFEAVPGGWGAQGYTSVWLDRVEADELRDALETAWRSVAPKRLAASRA